VTADDKPSIVFAHGLWADGSCFARVISELQAEGYEAISSGYGLESLDGDVAATIRTLGRVTSPSVLVGHCPATSIERFAKRNDVPYRSYRNIVPLIQDASSG